MGMSAIQQRSYLIPFRHQCQSLKCIPTAPIALANTSLCHQHSQIQHHRTRPGPANPLRKRKTRWPWLRSSECCKTFKIVCQDAFDLCSIINKTNVHMGQAVREQRAMRGGREKEYDDDQCPISEKKKKRKSLLTNTTQTFAGRLRSWWWRLSASGVECSLIYQGILHLCINAPNLLKIGSHGTKVRFKVSAGHRSYLSKLRIFTRSREASYH